MSRAPFLRLPAELHHEIGSHLDLFALSSLRLTCRSLHTAYGHPHFTRLSFLLGIFINFHSFPVPDHTAQRYYFNSEFPIPEDIEMSGQSWIMSFFERAMKRINPATLMEWMRANGAWDSWDAVMILLYRAIEELGEEEERLGFVEMLVTRFFELEGKYEYQLLLQTVTYGRIKCIRLLEERKCRPYELNEVQLNELLGRSLNRFNFVKRDPKARYEVIEYVVENLGAKIQGISTLSSFISAANLPPERMTDGLMELFEKVVALFCRKAGIDLKTLGPHDGLLLTGEFYQEPVLKLLGRAGFYLGPFDEASSGKIHGFASTKDIEILDILVKQGCNVDQLTEDGNTPLLIVLRHMVKQNLGNEEKSEKNQAENLRLGTEDYQNRDNIRFFLSNGADPFIVNKKGETAITIAMVLGDQKLIEDMVQFDRRREGRYGSLSPAEVYEKWMNDDELWSRLVYPGTCTRYDLEPQLVKLPQKVKQDEIDYLELKGRTGRPFRSKKKITIYYP